MKLYINEKMIIIFPKLLSKIDSGQQGTVYKYKGKALKIPYDHSNIFDTNYDISAKDCEYLKKINTKRILLPEDSLTNRKGDLRAYTLELITKNDHKALFNISKDKFLDELYAVREELKLLSENNVRVNDLAMKNFMYDGMFRFVDCGRYSVSYNNLEKMDMDIIRRIKRDNNNEFKDFIISGLFFKDEIVSSEIFTEVAEEISTIGGGFVGGYVEKTMPKHATLNEYVKKRFISKIA